MKYRKCYATQRDNNYSAKDALVIEVFETADKDAEHKTLLSTMTYQNSLGCPDAEYESIKHLVGNKKETTWTDVAEKALDAFTR